MKARVKATGEIIELYYDFRDMEHDFLDEKGKGYMSNELTIFDNEDYEQGWNHGYYEAVNTNTDPDYWEKLLHQYAGMAMQGLLSNQNIGADVAYMVNLSIEYANALVEKLKSIEK